MDTRHCSRFLPLAWDRANHKVSLVSADDRLIEIDSDFYTEYAQIEQKLNDELHDKERSFRFFRWLLAVLACTIAYVVYQRAHDSRWEITEDSPAVSHIRPGLFTDQRTYFVWGEDKNNGIGWIPSDAEGNVLPNGLAVSEFFPTSPNDRDY